MELLAEPSGLRRGDFLGVKKFIFISTEDNIIRVSGGIGTYLGIMTRTVKEQNPDAEVIWISRADNNEHSFIDDHGVHRIYIDPFKGDLSDRPFFNSVDGPAHELLSFIQQASAKTLELIDETTPTMIEVGEWEGHGAFLFKEITSPNVVKVCKIHTPLASCIKTNQLEPSTINAIQLWLEYETLRNAKVLTPCTKFIQDRAFFDTGYSPTDSQKVRVTPNPINTSSFVPNKISRDEAINLMNNRISSDFLTKDTFNIFFIGSIEKRKGADIFAKSINEIADQNPHVRFCMLGHIRDDNGDLTANKKFSRADILSHIKPEHHNKVATLGYVEHSALPELIHAADLVSVNYLADNFPGVVAETCLSGIPIVALERGGVTEMLTDPKTDQFVAFSIGYETQDAHLRLADKTNKIINTENLKEKGFELHELITRKYNPSSIVKELINYLDTYYENR